MWLSTEFLGALAELQKAFITFVMSVCLPTCITAVRTGWISVKFRTGYFYGNSHRIKIWLKSDKNIGHKSPLFDWSGIRLLFYPRRQILRERATMLRSVYITYLLHGAESFL